ncbi:hypothetical protein B0H63DRAFT_430212 [Podospora didyma]|uniref:DnaJ homologue subfamily C member 28 conserved domain-containing protein n=1 Tax=Podospora didyma TaxID=330526 RepID=A0AAE0NRM4_9PEZI|nr:hypothetical protein B0H63DRAFT_430212 [Podospora didyma]
MAPVSPFICGSCIRTMRRPKRLPVLTLTPVRARYLSRSPKLSSLPPTHPTEQATESHANTQNASSTPNSPPPPKEQGPMARRLQEATEEAMFTGGRAGRRAIEDAGFSDELKSKLLEKLADAKFQAENSAAFMEAGITGALPETAGQGTRQIATSQPWTGQETTEDTVLRMLNDAHKPLAPGLRRKPQIPLPVVDMRLRRDQAVSKAQRASSARDKAQAYTGMGMGKDTGLSDAERESVKKEFRARFQPGARAMPNTITGLAALANERIEDAISRGQFKNIPRGKGVERDARADNPFIDTTEYIMNKMIKRQEIVPPWIEKQQELVKTASIFRARLRNDWKRHAARTIASWGGSLEQQMNRAAEYARAEEVHNPRGRNVEQISVPTNATDDVVMVQIRQQAPVPTAGSPQEGVDLASTAASPETTSSTPPNDNNASTPSFSRPFRDPQWEAAERSYMELAIANLNAIARSYNLMAPELAKKPYFSLQRELNNCYADVAPEVANAIRDRATKTAKSLIDPDGHTQPSSMLYRLGGQGDVAPKVYDSTAPHYGFKEMWRDIWGKGK